jgi:hypothetical protein
MLLRFPVLRLCCVLLLCAAAAPVHAQLTAGPKMTDFAKAFGIDGANQAVDYNVDEIAVRAGDSSMANVLWPGEKADFLLHFTNKTHHDIKGKATIVLEHYGTSVPPGDVWHPTVFKIDDAGSVPIELDLPSGGTQDITIHPDVPERFGGYALISDVPGHGRSFIATLVRTLAADPGRVQFPTFALDFVDAGTMSEGVYVLFQKLGIKGVRLGTQYWPTNDPKYNEGMERTAKYMDWARKHDLTIMMTLSAGNTSDAQPLGRPRPWLTPEGEMIKRKDDRAWLPSLDDDFQKWVRTLSATYGWPKGNLNAMELWNEPWDGASISGWGADIPRYREMYTHMAEGIVQARQSDNVKVLIGGTCSSTNARDKLFPDGKDTFLKWTDFVSIHYQALSADPSLERIYQDRVSPLGPVRTWDTESWIANSEDRVAGVIASMRAQGQSRTAGVYRGNAYDARIVKVGNRAFPVVQAWSTAAAIAATQKFIGQRDFNQILFKNGLPWVFVFDGAPLTDGGKAKGDDGTVVIVGDLSKVYSTSPDRPLFRSVPVDAKASLSIKDPEGIFRLYDFYGNRVPATAGVITVPLNGLGYFVRSDGSAGSFQKLIEAIRIAHSEGYAPVQIVAHDLTAAVEDKPTLKITLTNILNRPVQGRLAASLGDLKLAVPTQTISLGANESRDILIPVTEGTAAANNLYPLTSSFDAGADGSANHEELMHANVIARRTIHVDGDLSDWKGVLPEILPGKTIGASQTEEAYLPFENFSKGPASGASTVYLAYDDQNFYFAAKISDDTPDPGMVRFANRDDDSYFYPNVATDAQGKLLVWPSGVRHYTYRRNYETPVGTSLHDNVQIAFNVLDQKPWLPNPPGTMPHFIDYWDTDYEYALNPVAAAYGGGTEIWRSLAPGTPRKTDFPREPKAAFDQGPVSGGKLVIKHDGNTRIVEAAIPWTEMPEVWKRMQAGKTVKFSCRVNDNGSPARELATGRSVSKDNGPAFHDAWQTHWANEIEFGVGK